jgi:hypothetical protein
MKRALTHQKLSLLFYLNEVLRLRNHRIEPSTFFSGLELNTLIGVAVSFDDDDFVESVSKRPRLKPDRAP